MSAASGLSNNQNAVTVEFADAKTGQVVDTVTGTPEHPFYVSGRGMTALGSLGIGTLVVTRAGPAAVVKSLVRHHSAAGAAGRQNRQHRHLHLCLRRRKPRLRCPLRRPRLVYAGTV
jgi:hypothetical protein